ncbi:hypothetical protein D8674_024302 [Pyrus ussuriensis x Pyrus communis]|uniref:Uncharacterized protein n=1 Tax=Pyrus ussuriensis x Pyrus communis TaxID=2448454 RepID=A0A5N5H9L9_9ROSA|nr:hypothetical protein D8674_024302 [Pyrus ussuriensis x Pyrus communis]
MYLEDVETTFNRSQRNNDGGVRKEKLSVFAQIARPFGDPVKGESFTKKDMEIAHWFILNNCDDALPYLEEHEQLMKREHPSHLYAKKHRDLFPSWFHTHMNKLKALNSPSYDEELYNLARGPLHVELFSGCHVNGIKFLGPTRDDKLSTQNSGVHVPGAGDSEDIDFYSKLTSVVQLLYKDRWKNSRLYLWGLPVDFHCICLCYKLQFQNPFILLVEFCIAIQEQHSINVCDSLKVLRNGALEMASSGRWATEWEEHAKALILEVIFFFFHSSLMIMTTSVCNLMFCFCSPSLLAGNFVDPVIDSLPRNKGISDRENILLVILKILLIDLAYFVWRVNSFWLVCKETGWDISHNLPCEIRLITRRRSVSNAPPALSASTAPAMKIPKETKRLVRHELSVIYDLEDISLEVMTYLEETLANRYKNWKKIARLHVPSELKDRPDDWEWLCKHFTDPKFVKKSIAGQKARESKTLPHHSGSKPFLYRLQTRRQEVSKFPAIDMFKDVYVRPGYYGGKEHFCSPRSNIAASLRDPDRGRGSDNPKDPGRADEGAAEGPGRGDKVLCRGVERPCTSHTNVRPSNLTTSTSSWSTFDLRATSPCRYLVA